MSDLKRKHKKRRGLIFNKRGDMLVIKINRIEMSSTNPGEVIVFGMTDEIFKADTEIPQVIIHNVIHEFIQSRANYQDPDS